MPYDINPNYYNKITDTIIKIRNLNVSLCVQLNYTYGNHLNNHYTQFSTSATSITIKRNVPAYLQFMLYGDDNKPSATVLIDPMFIMSLKCLLNAGWAWFMGGIFERNESNGEIVITQHTSPYRCELPLGYIEICPNVYENTQGIILTIRDFKDRTREDAIFLNINEFSYLYDIFSNFNIYMAMSSILGWYGRPEGPINMVALNNK